MKKKNIEPLPTKTISASTEVKPTRSAPDGILKPDSGRPGLADQFFSTLALVCRIPLPFSFTFRAQRLDLWLPVTALFQSLVFITGLGLFGFIFRDPNLALIAAFMLLYGCFNLFHFDGLLDTADAFLGAFDWDKRLAILKDPRVGVYGIFTACMYLILKLMILQSLLGHLPALSLSIYVFPLAGKTAASLIPAIYPPAKNEGLGALAAGSRLRFVVAGFLLACALYTLLFLVFSLFTNFSFLQIKKPYQDAASFSLKHHFWNVPLNDIFLIRLLISLGFTSLIIILSALITALFLGRLYQKGLGGYTGDTLGAAVELGELVYLTGLFLLVQWGVLI
ncbi:adenosylcobinamide-GDP ribazoletransferase [Gracilinema caldarium]|uniref:Adenosylcobinamide-GDP ribazoletransferase n=1 Tax=Gracilinema caldarium (strain ATCC 51460 / DSM 7334 / H1) TaxID=744872 RepID=F8EZB3_GRAC1|nr:adenosylcobinamide-GDP ribazoletransferase [Gracilinema caldarium]AEJ19705.1 Cobalamin synthase [Gracilinema caldarium DSM 7334]